MNRFSRFCTAHGRKSLYFAMGNPFPQNCAFLWEGSGPHLIHASFSQTESTVQITSRSVQLFSHSWPQSVPILYSGRPFPSKLPLPTGDLDPHLTHNSLGSSKPTVQTASLSVQLFFCTDDCRVSLYFTMGRPFPPSKLPLPIGGSGPPSGTWFPGPTQVLNPNGILIGSAVLVGLTSVTDWQTTLLSR